MSQGRRRSPLPPGWDRRIRPRILRRDQRTCQLAYPDICTGRATEVDHIGDDDDHSDTNLRAVCHPCHARRTGRQARAAQPDRRRPTEPHPGLR